MINMLNKIQYVTPRSQNTLERRLDESGDAYTQERYLSICAKS